MEVRIATSDAEIESCFSVMHQLRPHLIPERFVERIRAQQQDGFELVFLVSGDQPVAVAGMRFLETLVNGRYLHVDDLVVLESERSLGHGAALLRWIVERAESEGCTGVQLDSGTQRTDAHRFYEREGFVRTGHHFARTLRRTSDSR
jgi:GNAT superfamily N-acetyltransferase